MSGVGVQATLWALSRLQLHIREIGGPRQLNLRTTHYAKSLPLPGERKSMEPMDHRVEDAQYEANQF